MQEALTTTANALLPELTLIPTLLTLLLLITLTLLPLEGITHTTRQLITRKERKKEEYIQIMRHIIHNHNE